MDQSVATEMLASWTRGDFETTRSLITEDMTTQPDATVPAVGWYRIRDGKVAALQVFVDPARCCSDGLALTSTYGRCGKAFAAVGRAGPKPAPGPPPEPGASSVRPTAEGRGSYRQLQSRTRSRSGHP